MSHSPCYVHTVLCTKWRNNCAAGNLVVGNIWVYNVTKGYAMLTRHVNTAWYSVIAPEASVWTQRNYPDSKVHGANKGPIWDRQDPGGPHAGPMQAPWAFLSGYAYIVAHQRVMGCLLWEYKFMYGINCELLLWVDLILNDGRTVGCSRY